MTGNTINNSVTWYEFKFIHVKDEGYMNLITDPVDEEGINLKVIGMHIDGGGLVTGTNLYFHAVNCTIDSGGVLKSGDCICTK